MHKIESSNHTHKDTDNWMTALGSFLNFYSFDILYRKKNAPYDIAWKL